MKKFCFLVFFFLLNFSVIDAHEIKEDDCECDECVLDDLEDLIAQIKDNYSAIVQEQEKTIPIRLSMQAQGPHAIENYKYLKFRNNLTGEIITPDFNYVDGRIGITNTHLINVSKKCPLIIFLKCQEKNLLRNYVFHSIYQLACLAP